MGKRPRHRTWTEMESDCRSTCLPTWTKDMPALLHRKINYHEKLSQPPIPKPTFRASPEMPSQSKTTPEQIPLIHPTPTGGREFQSSLSPMTTNHPDLAEVTPQIWRKRLPRFSGKRTRDIIQAPDDCRKRTWNGPSGLDPNSGWLSL